MIRTDNVNYLYLSRIILIFAIFYPEETYIEPLLSEVSILGFGSNILSFIITVEERDL